MTLFLEFQLNLTINNIQLDFNYSLNGPSFYKYLPDGESEAIILKDDPEFTIKVWFERKGHVNKDIIVYHENKTDFDSTIIPKQLRLEGGHLYGEVFIKKLSPDVKTILQKSKSKYVPYEKFGKTVIKKIIYPHVSNFLNILRYNYGQFWIRELYAWDSRKISLLNYCRNINLKWSFNKKTWFDFVPSDKSIHYIKVPLKFEKHYQEYISKEDWNAIQNMVSNSYQPTLSLQLLTESHMLSSFDNLKHSFIIAVIAFEISINEFINLKVDESLKKLIGQFNEMNNKSKLIIIGSVLNIPNNYLIRASEAIDIRNEIVHEGKYEDKKENAVKLFGLMRVISKINSATGIPECKFPQYSFPGRLQEFYDRLSTLSRR